MANKKTKKIIINKEKMHEQFDKYASDLKNLSELTDSFQCDYDGASISQNLREIGQFLDDLRKHLEE